MPCTRCGAALQPEFRFCPNCGQPVAGAAVVSGDAGDERFARLAKHIPQDLAQKIRASERVGLGERKLVTVVFCDLVGSTAIAELLDPEEYRDLLDKYVELAFREIYRFEGIVNQLAGDGVMALFGAPIAHEDAPHRAVSAALAIRAALDEFNRTQLAKRDLELQARIGIHTGPVVVGNVGNDFKMDYTATGDTTNLASRLESLAGPGTIFISDATFRLVQGFFEVRAVGPFKVKGKSEPVRAYEVIGTRETATAMTVAAARGLTPLVGRAQELWHLRDCYERLAQREPQVVEVVGEAGSGKSRLIYEFQQQVVHAGAVVFEARCSALTRLQPLAPIANMLRPFFGLGPGDPPEDSCRKVMARLRELETPEEPLGRFYPYVCHLLSLPGTDLGDRPAEELKQEMFVSVAHLVMAPARTRPVVIIIEDLHWIDDVSRELIELAVGKLQSAQLMLVVTHRRDYQPAWHTAAPLTVLNLQRLSDDDTVEMVRNIAGGPVSWELERRILQRAEGNPFFTEEITRALVDEGYLERRDGFVEVTRPVADIRIPTTVQELLEARLDRLGPEAKRVTQVAAVLGRQFSRAHLTQLLDGEDLDVDTELSELEERGIIHRKTVQSADEFRFGESLTQEVAYEALLLKERRRLHERVGFLLEGLGSDPAPDRSALTALHFSRSDNRRKAVEALLRAGQDAERLPSWNTAADFYRQAWELVEAMLAEAINPEEQLRRWAVQSALSLNRINVLYATGDGAIFERAARRGRELAESLGDIDAVAGFCTYSGIRLTADRERFAEGLALVEEGFSLAQQHGSQVTTISIARGLAYAYLFDGRFDLAQGIAEWVVRELETTGQHRTVRDLYLSARWMRELLLYYSDDFDGALTGVRETYRLAVEAPNRTIQIQAAHTIGQLYFMRGEYEEAKVWCDRSIEMAQAISHTASLRIAAALALATRVQLGETSTASRYFDWLEEGLAAGANAVLNVRLTIEALTALGDLPRAERLARMAHARAAGRLKEMLTASALGDVLFRLGPSHWDEADLCYQQAMTLAETARAQSIVACTLMGTGELAAARGDSDGARVQLERALAICHGLQLRYYETKIERLLAALPAAVTAEPAISVGGGS